MAWRTIAQGDFETFRNAQPDIGDLPAGTRLRLDTVSFLPVAPFVNLWGMDWVIRKMYDDAETIVTGVRSDGWYRVTIDMEAEGTPPLIVIYTICAILIIVGLVILVRSMSLLYETVGPVVSTGLIVLGVGALGLLGYGLYKARR